MQEVYYQYGKFRGGELKKDLISADADRKAVTEIKAFLNNEAGKILESAKTLNYQLQRTDLRCHTQSIGSADLVLDDPEKVMEILDQDRKVVAFEMESFAVLKTASVLGTKGIIIKSVSDIPQTETDRSLQESFRPYAKYTATEAFYRFATRSIFF